MDGISHHDIYRLWLGGAVSPHRELELIQVLANKIRILTLCRPLLLAVDGLASFTAFHKAFRTALPRRKDELGRPQLISPLRRWSSNE